MFRASLVSHASAHFARQHRTALFQLVLVNRWARFIRWDRSGAVVSERFDYIAHPQLLAEFLWRYSHLDEAARGWDRTVTAASKREKGVFVDAVRAFLHAQEASPQDGGRGRVRRLPGAARTLDDTGSFPTWKVQIGRAHV